MTCPDCGSLHILPEETRAWELQDDGLLLRLWSAGYEVGEIAAEAGRTPGDVTERLREHGLAVPLPIDSEAVVLAGHTECDRIARVVAHLAGVPQASICARTREVGPTMARHVSLALARERIGMSTTRLGRIFGRRDHSTVLHGIKRVKRDLANDGPCAALYRASVAALDAEKEAAV